MFSLYSTFKMTSLFVKNCVNLPGIIRRTGVRMLRTTTTHHPEPVYDQEAKVLDKILQERGEDRPVSLRNPYEKPPRKCILCQYGIEPNYKNVKLLAQFQSPYTGMMYARHVTGLCKKKHGKLEREIKKAVSLGFMPSYLKEVEFLKDPKICDVERPLKPHKYC